MATTTPKTESSEKIRGNGIVYPRGRIWWIQLYNDGVVYRESSKSTDKKVAEKLLIRRLGDRDHSDLTPNKVKRVRVRELGEDWLRQCKNDKHRSYADEDGRWRNHLLPFFGPLRATAVTSEKISRYIESRQEAGAAVATINRELSALRAAFYLAYNSKPRKVTEPLKLKLAKEENTRTGFIEETQYQKLVAAGPPLFLRTLLEIGREFGWRKGELLKLRVSQIDLQKRMIVLPATDTKNKKPRKVFMTEQIHVLVTECVRGKQAHEFVFTRPNSKPGAKPTPVREFRNLWHALCRKAGLGVMVHRPCFDAAVRESGNKDRLVPAEFALVKRICPRCDERVRWYNRKYVGLLFHDLRRSAVRDMVRGGTSEKVAMTITGHLGRSVFDRYNIGNERDLQEATARAEEYRRTQRQALLDQENRYNSDTMASGAPKTASDQPVTIAKPLPGTLQ